MRLTDKFLPQLHPGLSTDKSEGVKTSWQRSTLLVLAITMQNIDLVTMATLIGFSVMMILDVALS